MTDWLEKLYGPVIDWVWDWWLWVEDFVRGNDV